MNLMPPLQNIKKKLKLPPNLSRSWSTRRDLYVFLKQKLNFTYPRVQIRFGTHQISHDMTLAKFKQNDVYYYYVYASVYAISFQQWKINNVSIHRLSVSCFNYASPLHVIVWWVFFFVIKLSIIYHQFLIWRHDQRMHKCCLVYTLQHLGYLTFNW